MKISEFVGNGALKEQFVNMFANNKVPHAIILEGQPGTGKKTFANILANFAVCAHINGGPCYECASCKKALNGTHPDIIFPEKSGALQAVNVSEVRRIKKDSYVVPNEAPQKVYIFTDVDNMGVQAQNSLLKVLEEPPKNVIFIFTCINLGNILPTVRSRAQVFKLSSVNKNEAESFLLKNYHHKDESSIKEAVQLSCGNLGKAIEILNEEQVKCAIILADNAVKSIAKLNAFDIMTSLGKLLAEKKELKNILNLIYSKVKNALLISAGGSSQNGCEAALLLAQKVNKEKIFKVLAVLDKSLQLCEQNVNKDLIVTYICAELHKFVCI